MGDRGSRCCCDPVVPWYDMLIADNAGLDYSEANDDRNDFHASPTLTNLLDAYPAAAFIDDGDTNVQFIGPSDNDSSTSVVDEEFNLPRKQSSGIGDSFTGSSFKYDIESELRTLAVDSGGLFNATSGTHKGENGFVGLRHSAPLEGAACILFIQLIDSAQEIRDGVIFLNSSGAITGSVYASGLSNDPDTKVFFAHMPTGKYNRMVGYNEDKLVSIGFNSISATNADDPAYSGYDADGDLLSNYQIVKGTDNHLHVVEKDGTITVVPNQDFVTTTEYRAGTPRVIAMLGRSYPKAIVAKWTGTFPIHNVAYHVGEHVGGTTDDEGTTGTEIFSVTGNYSQANFLFAGESEGTYAIAAEANYNEAFKKVKLLTDSGDLTLWPTTGTSTTPFFINADISPSTQNYALREIDETTAGGLTFGEYGSGSEAQGVYEPSLAQFAVFQNGSGKTSESNQADSVMLLPWSRTSGVTYYQADLIFFSGTSIIAVKRTKQEFSSTSTSDNDFFSRMGIVGASDRYAYVNFGLDGNGFPLQVRFRRDGRAQKEININFGQDDTNQSGGGTHQWLPVATSVEADNTAVPWDAVDGELGNFTDTNF